MHSQEEQVQTVEDSLFAELNERVSYVLLTDLEEGLSAKDIDLYVPEAERKLFLSILKDHGWVRRREESYHVNHHFYYHLQTSAYLDVKFQLDFANGKKERWLYIDDVEMANTRVKNSRGLFRPSGIHAILIYAAHIGLLERATLEDRHVNALKDYIALYRGEADAADADSVVQMLEEALARPRTEIVGQVKSVISAYFSKTSFAMTQSRGLRLGMGFRVLLLGTDGTGKTTLVEETKQALNVKVKTLYLGMGEEGWRLGAVQRLSHYRPKSRLGSAIKAVLYTYGSLPFELLLRHVFALKGGKYSLFLIDRFPGWPFTKSGVRRAIYKAVLPKPDLVVLLTGDPAVLATRKPEIEELQSKEDQKKFQKVARAIGSGQLIEVDTTALSVEESVDRIVTSIIDHPVYRKNMFKDIAVS